VTSQEPHPQLIADPDIPDTEVILVAQPAPVFVDSTGRRRRLLRRLAYGFGAFCMVYGGLISLSLAGGPVSPGAVMPFPELIDRGAAPSDGKPWPTPEPIVTAPKSVLVNDATPRRGGAAGSWDDGASANRTRTANPTRAAGPSTPTTRKTGRPTATATRPPTKPVEATPSATATTGPAATATPTVNPSPSSGSDTGTKAPGAGGGTSSDDTDDTGSGTSGVGGGSNPDECPVQPMHLAEPIDTHSPTGSLVPPDSLIPPGLLDPAGQLIPAGEAAIGDLLGPDGQPLNPDGTLSSADGTGTGDVGYDATVDPDQARFDDDDTQRWSDEDDEDDTRDWDDAEDDLGWYDYPQDAP
jgi:hypothetical protein